VKGLTRTVTPRGIHVKALHIVLTNANSSAGSCLGLCSSTKRRPETNRPGRDRLTVRHHSLTAIEDEVPAGLSSETGCGSDACNLAPERMTTVSAVTYAPHPARCAVVPRKKVSIYRPPVP
jgi:hypothetical protein